MATPQSEGQVARALCQALPCLGPKSPPTTSTSQRCRLFPVRPGLFCGAQEEPRRFLQDLKNFSKQEVFQPILLWQMAEKSLDVGMDATFLCRVKHMDARALPIFNYTDLREPLSKAYQFKGRHWSGIPRTVSLQHHTVHTSLFFNLDHPEVNLCQSLFAL